MYEADNNGQKLSEMAVTVSGLLCAVVLQQSYVVGRVPD